MIFCVSVSKSHASYGCSSTGDLPEAHAINLKQGAHQIAEIAEYVAVVVLEAGSILVTLEDNHWMGPECFGDFSIVISIADKQGVGWIDGMVAKKIYPSIGLGLAKSVREPVNGLEKGLELV